MAKAISTETIEWPKLRFVMTKGVETELPEDKKAAAIILAHPSVKAVEEPKKPINK